MSGLFEGYQIVSPPFDEADGRRLAEELFGRRGDAAELGSHQDRNFLITGADGGRSVLKIANPHFGHDSLEMQNAAMHHLAAAGLPFATPVPIPSLQGSEIVPVDRDGETYDVRMTSWVDGEPMTEARHLDAKARSDLGAIAAEAALALHGFDHPAADRVLQWDLKHARAVVDGLIRHVDDPARRELVERSMRVHDRALERLAADLRVQVIHGDVTDFNVVGRRDGDGRLMPCGLIDFGDMTRSYLVAEAAVAAASLTWHDPDDALAVIVDVVSGFHARLPLTEPELAAVFPLVLGRAAGGAVSTWQQAMAEPGNRYANDLIEIDWGSLAAVAAVDPDLAEAACRAACGMDPHPASAALGAPPCRAGAGAADRPEGPCAEARRPDRCVPRIRPWRVGDRCRRRRGGRRRCRRAGRRALRRGAAAPLRAACGRRAGHRSPGRRPVRRCRRARALPAGCARCLKWRRSRDARIRPARPRQLPDRAGGDHTGGAADRGRG